MVFILFEICPFPHSIKLNTKSPNLSDVLEFLYIGQHIHKY